MLIYLGVTASEGHKQRQKASFENTNMSLILRVCHAFYWGISLNVPENSNDTFRPGQSE